MMISCKMCSRQKGDINDSKTEVFSQQNKQMVSNFNGIRISPAVYSLFSGVFNGGSV